jgi:rubrerythrin
MKKPTDIGKNRTGIATSPFDSKDTVQGAKQGAHQNVNTGSLDGARYAAEKLAWSRGADPVGTMPPPLTVKGVAKAAVQMVQGHKPTVFLDKLGERLAFERSGVRLYEALMVKLEAGDPHEGGPTREDLEHIRDDELRHYAIVRDAMRRLGADPTAITPCADVTAVMSLGLVQVLNDPRTTLTQCLEAVLAAELVDNDAWVLLVDLADELGEDDLAREFRNALVQEEIHLEQVRTWIANAVRGQAGVDRTPSRPDAQAP